MSKFCVVFYVLFFRLSQIGWKNISKGLVSASGPTTSPMNVINFWRVKPQYYKLLIIYFRLSMLSLPWRTISCYIFRIYIFQNTKRGETKIGNKKSQHVSTFTKLMSGSVNFMTFEARRLKAGWKNEGFWSPHLCSFKLGLVLRPVLGCTCRQGYKVRSLHIGNGWVTVCL